MCNWLEEILDYWFPPQRAEGQASKVLRQEPVEQDIDGELVEHDWYAPLPKPPEFLLRPELIPIKEPDGAAVEEAERVLRR